MDVKLDYNGETWHNICTIVNILTGKPVLYRLVEEMVGELPEARSIRAAV